MISSERKSLLRFFSLALLVCGLSFLQAYGFSILNIKPNFALLAVVASAFFVSDFFESAFLVLLAALILKFGPGVEGGIATFSILGVAAAALAKLIPWRYLVGNLTTIVIAVLIFYLVLNPEIILSQVFFKELFLDIVFSSLIFAFLNFLWQDK